MDDALSDLLASDQEEPGHLEGTLHRILTAAAKVFAADLCTLFPINPVTGRFLHTPLVHGARRAPAAELPPPREEGLTREALRHRLLLVADLAAAPQYQSAFSLAEEVRCFAALALATTRQEKPLAVLYIDFRSLRDLEAEREALARFAREASRVLQTTWFLRRYRSVARIGQDINRHVESHLELFRMVHAHLAGILDVSHGLLLAIYQPATNNLDLYANFSGREVTETGHDLSGICGLVMRSGGWFLRQSGTEELPAPVERIGQEQGSQPPPALLYVPLQLGGEALGVIAVQHYGSFAFDQEDRHILELLANHLALALGNLRLFTGLQHLNQAGQTLTRHLEESDVLQRVVDEIRTMAEADIAVLYPFFSPTGEFERPARVAGTLRDPEQLQRGAERADDMARLAVAHPEPVFATDSRELYRMLGGDSHTRRGNFEQREEVCSAAALPLAVAQERVGVLFVNYKSPQRFDEAQQLLLRGLASFAAIALKNAREFGAQARRNLRHLELLQQIDRELNRHTDLKRLLHSILDLASEHFHSHQAAVILFDARRELLRIEAAAGVERDRREGQALRLAEARGIVAEVVQDQAAVLVSDVRASRWQDLFAEMGSSTLSEMDVPILDGGEVMGVLSFESPQPHAFQSADLELVRTLAGQAVLAIKKAQAFEAERRLASERQTLIDLGKEITRQLEVDKVLDLVVRRAQEITLADVSILGLRQGETLTVRAQAGNTSAKPVSTISLSQGIAGKAVREGKPVNAADVNHPDWQGIYIPAFSETRSELAVPFQLEGVELALQGVLEVESREIGHFGDRDTRLLENLADLSLVALQNAERYGRAEKRRNRLKALHRVGHQIIRSPEDPDRVIEAVLEQALTLLGKASFADLDLIEEGKVVTSYLGRRNDTTGAVTLERQDHEPAGSTQPWVGVMAQVMQTLKPYRTGNAGSDPYYVPRGEGDEMASDLAVPLKRQGPAGEEELAGVLNVESTLPDAFDDDDQEVLELFAAQALLALDIAFHFKQAERRHRRFSALLRAVRELGEIDQEQDLGQAYRLVVQIASEYFDGSQVVVRRLDPASGRLEAREVARTTGIQPHLTMHLGRGLNGQVAAERGTRLVPDTASPPPGTWPLELSDPSARSLAITPIQTQADSSYYGNLALSHEQRGYFRDADVKLLEGLATELAVTIQRVDRLKEIQETRQRVVDAEAMSWFAEHAFAVAHDLGNDLGLVPTRVRKISRALAEGQPESIEGELEKIRSSVAQALSRAKRVQDELATADRPQPERIRAELLLHETCESFQPQSDGLILRRSWPEPLAEVEVVDREIRAALLNVLVNAEQAMPGGGVITVTGEADEHEVRLRVADNGHGISQENLEKIWRPFFSTKGSSGFGLFSARMNVLRNGGIIAASSEVGNGSVFTIRLRRADRGGREDIGWRMVGDPG